MAEKTLALHLLEKFQADREKIERYASIAELCPIPAFVMASDGLTVLYLNPAYFELTGRTLEQLQNGEWPLVVHPDDRAEVIRSWKMFTETKQRHSHWHRYVHSSGKVTPAMTIVDRVEGNGYVGFIIPQCDRGDCPVREMNLAAWKLSELHAEKLRNP